MRVILGVDIREMDLLFKRKSKKTQEDAEDLETKLKSLVASHRGTDVSQVELFREDDFDGKRVWSYVSGAPQSRSYYELIFEDGEFVTRHFKQTVEEAVREQREAPLRDF